MFNPGLTSVSPLGSPEFGSSQSNKCPPDAEFVPGMVPHCDDIDALQTCLRGVRNRAWPADRMEVIVADNNSMNRLDAVAEAARGFRVVPASPQGACPVGNAGAAVVRGEILSLIDGGCNPCSHWIENGAQAREAHDFAGGHVETAARDPARPTPVEAWEIEFGFNFARHIQAECCTGSGNTWVWRRVLRAVGGFCAGIAEEFDRSSSATRAAIRHLARPLWLDLLKRRRRVTAGHYALTRDKPAGLMRWLAWTAAMPLTMGRHLYRICCTKRLHNHNAELASACVLISPRFWRAGFMIRLVLTQPASIAP